MKKLLWTLAAVILLGYLGISSALVVPETHMAMVTQFGKPTRAIHQAGLAFKWPDPIETAVFFDKRQQLLSLEPTELVTLDRRNLVVSAFVVWRIVDPGQFLTSLRSMDTAEQRLSTLASSEIGAALAARPITQIFTLNEQDFQLNEMFEQISRSANRIAERELGIEVVTVRPNRFGFPKQNLLAIYKRMESERDRIARQYRAEGQEQAATLRAETEREVRQMRAQAQREAQALIGQSEAEAARRYADAYQTNADYYRFIRTLEAYNQILGEDTRLVLSAESPLFDLLFNPPEFDQP
ncbi:protease modulator HflC [Marinimicrobium sp. LS-A18]|uniref:protease modulator HflC n=1 Tax=Marinimicrobium sp. LS-A18 TaxID=1381596 RepID=UPI000467A002|nr:protease modulator HflC [Marinimicrobium sp. LS-A18]